MASGTTVDTSELDRELADIEGRVLDYTPITPVLADILVACVSDEWDSAGRGRWAPLAASTLYKRRKKGLGAEILKNTGRSAGSVRGESDANSASAVTDVATMVFHVSDAARSLIPLRNPFDVEDAAWGDLSLALGEYIADNEH